MPLTTVEPDPTPAPRRSASIFARFLWWCAGADGELLATCPYSDQVKFHGMGGVVFATGVLAFLSGSYAFYTVFSPKDSVALEAAYAPEAMLPSIAAGLVWALVIFNLERFIVSSAGKGDGTDKITFGELLNATPRILMAMVTGICLAKPLEIRILQSEIDAELNRQQMDYIAELDSKSDASILTKKETLERRKTEIEDQISDSEQDIEKRRQEINAQRKALEDEASGASATGKKGRGPAWLDKKENLDKMERELEYDQNKAELKQKQAADELAETKAEISEMESKHDADREAHKAEAKNLNGLLKRIQIAHDLSPTMSLMLTLLLMSIEMAPIFFKMMLTKGAYDYLAENQKELARARAGIEPEGRILVDGTREEVRDVYYAVEAIEAEERRRFETEQRLAALVHEEFIARTSMEISRDPAPFMRGTGAMARRTGGLSTTRGAAVSTSVTGSPPYGGVPVDPTPTGPVSRRGPTS